MKDSYKYVAPDYKISFGIGGDWFWFRDKSFAISGELKNGDWTLGYFRFNERNYCITEFRIVLDDMPYETLVLFRKALGIKGLEWVLDKEVTLLEEEK